MRNKETGEFELVVGDRQLLSGFFIFALLLGVVFAMGYVVGQNSPRQAKAGDAAAAPSAAAAQEARPQPAPATAAEQAPAAAQAATGDGAQQPGAEPPPQPTTMAAREAIPGAPPAAQPPAASAPAIAAGSYWQVMAVKQASDAQPMFQTLKDGGMPAYLRAEADGKTHLLVGPWADASALARAKADLTIKFNCRELYLRKLE